MRNSKILAKHRAGEPARLAMLGYFLPPFVAWAARLGYDGIWLDAEHQAFDDRELQTLFAFFHHYDIDCLFRPSTREKARLYRYLEDGATGLVIPHVNTAADAADLVRSVKFPPVGDRGLHGRGLDSDFGTTGDRNAFVQHALTETFVILQIETPQAMQEAPAMLTIPGLDGLYVGPADLGLRLALQPESERITVEAAIEDIGSLCNQHGKLWGSLPRSVEELHHHQALGSNLLVWGLDGRIIQEGLTQAIHDFNT
jgi:4-hydroxy-2-oxoheptanedioate aldolase